MLRTDRDASDDALRARSSRRSWWIALVVGGACALPAAQQVAGGGGAGGVAEGGGGSGAGGAGGGPACEPVSCAASGGTCETAYCTFHCSTAAPCATVSCPPGMPCHIVCDGAGSCPLPVGCAASVPLCWVACNAGACGDVECNSPECNIDCDHGSCSTATCTNIVRTCDVSCRLGSCSARAECAAGDYCAIACFDACPVVISRSRVNEVTCAGNLTPACEDVTCSVGSCDIGCAGQSCAAVDCAAACSCKTTGCAAGTGGGAATPNCTSLACKDGATCQQGGECSVTPSVCDGC